MDKIFQKFLRSNIDLSSVGVECREENLTYFCTPKGASSFGWAGADGIHFCFIRGFGSMVFVVNPMNTAKKYVHPLADNFEDFLRLLLACGDAAAMEQVWMWDEKQFEAFLQKNLPAKDQQQILGEVSLKMGLMPMEYPWQYMHLLQSEFDYTRLKYTEDYYDIDMNPSAEPRFPEWKVYYEGNFRGHHGRDHAGKEITLNQQFDWAGYHWMIPAAYSCSKGLVIDFCMRVETEKIHNFIKKWNLGVENDSYDNFTSEEQMQMEAENPLYFQFHPELDLNGKRLTVSHGCSICFHPCLADENNNAPEVKWVSEHYGLESSYGWVIYRKSFPWKSKRCQEITSLSLTMRQQPGSVPGPHFKAHAPGDKFTFSHPVSGRQYTLTIQNLEPQTLPQDRAASECWIYPSHFITMLYTISPNPDESVLVSDCAESDQPVETVSNNDSFYPKAVRSVCCIGVIGGADGPTEVMCGGDTKRMSRMACSSLHFEPIQDDVEWRIMFSVKEFDDETFLLV